MKVRSISMILIAGMFTVSLVAAQDNAPGKNNWVRLFDGATLDGWHFSENPGTFSVRDGMIVVNGKRSHLFYDGPVQSHDFRNFEFKADIMALPNSNSGIFIHTRFQEEGWPKQGYEVQVCNAHPDNGNYRELMRTGSLYAVRSIHVSPVDDNEWFTMRIKVEGRHVQIFVNDVQTVDYIEPDKPFRRKGSKQSLLTRGTFALQGHDPGSTAHYKNIYVRPLPDAPTPPDMRSPKTIARQMRISRFSAISLPLIDFHCHLAQGLGIDQLLEQSRETSITYGVAVNCGPGCPVKNDESALEFLESLNGKPVFRAMQAEGPEWQTMFSPDVIDHFDYVMTDAMTFHDRRGRRMRLWINDEVRVDDPQDFMQMYVEQIEKILREEPIDIFANPTFLPEIIRDQYNELWTEERMDRVIAGLLYRGIALEINARYRIPSVAFIKRARNAGVKFAFGANNRSSDDVGGLEYCLEVAEELGLQKSDLWYPEE
jgi:histidinol phosphatase-like PHP family hydrolase